MTKEVQADANDKLTYKWNERLNQYIYEQYNNT